MPHSIKKIDRYLIKSQMQRLVGIYRGLSQKILNASQDTFSTSKWQKNEILQTLMLFMIPMIQGQLSFPYQTIRMPEEVCITYCCKPFYHHWWVYLL
jgi:hypothetical protein